MEKFEIFWDGGPSLFAGRGLFCPGSDSVILADFADTVKAKNICELGCGNGLISILLAIRKPPALISALEIISDSVLLARENAQRYALQDRVSVFCGDLRFPERLCKVHSFQLVVSNPPYFSADKSISSSASDVAAARSETLCTIEDVCRSASSLLADGGHFCLCFRPERLPELFSCLEDFSLEPKRLRTVHHSLSHPPFMVLVDAVRHGNPGLSVLPPFILKNENGGDSHEYSLLWKSFKIQTV